jgi:hypothetical protein
MFLLRTKSFLKSAESIENTRDIKIVENVIESKE